MREWLPLVLLIGAISLYRIWLIQHTGITLFVDEAQYWDWSRHLDWGYYSKPPVIAWLIAAVTSVLGNGVLAVKSVGLLVYALTAIVLHAWVRDMLGRVAAGWAVILWMTLPLVAGLSLFASTDAPLLLCWALSAWLLWRAQKTDAWSHWLLLGLSVGVGIMSKYTTAVFVFSALWALWGLKGPRQGLARSGPWLAACVAAMCVAPNVWWNVVNHFPTLRHTEEITVGAHQQGGFAPLIEFLLGQVLLIGPVTAWLVWRGFRDAGNTREVKAYALALSLPLLLVVSVQAFMSRANVNWASPAHLGLLVLALLGASTLRNPMKGVAWAALFSVILMGLVLHLKDFSQVLGKPLPAKLDIFVRMRGWDQVLAQVKQHAPAGLPVVTETRAWSAQVAYQWRDAQARPYAWNPERRVSNFYEMTTDLNELKGQDLLFLAESNPSSGWGAYASSVEDLGQVSVAVGPDRQLTLHAWVLRGFRGY